MKRGKLPESQSQRRKRQEQREQVRENAHTWDERHREVLESYWQVYQRRLDSEAAYSHFESVQAQLHALPPRFNPPDDPYNTHKEPLDFRLAYQRMLDYWPTNWDALIAFLERDPYSSGSGYCKQKILGRLKRAPLTETQKGWLRSILLRQVCKPPRRECRYYTRLAIVLDEPGFRQELERLEEEEGTWARWMRNALRHACREKV